MNNKERAKKFAEAEKKAIKALGLMTVKSIKDAIKLLNQTQNDITTILAETPTEWQIYHLNKTKAEIKSTLKELEKKLLNIGLAGANSAWNSGIQRIDSGLTAAGMMDVVYSMPIIDISRIATNKAFMLDRLTDIPAVIISKINAQLGAVSIGVTNRNDAIKNISKIITGGKSRAKTILGTELGRMAEIATNERRKEASKLIPGMKKQWVKSGKIHSRENHDLINGQTRKINEKFTISKHIKLDYPKDPKAPASETINCGCWTRTIISSWQVKNDI